MARKQGLLGIMPEPAVDVAAQVSAVANPLSAKTAAFMAPGTPVPRTVPAGTMKVTRPEGTLVTNSAQQASKFAKVRKVTDAHVAKQLGYPPETKAAAMKAGAPRVVQGRTASGAVAHESVASRAGTPAAIRAAAAAVPGGRVVVTSPRAVLLRRLSKRGT